MLFQMMRYGDPLLRLKRSPFRRSFHLTPIEKSIIRRQGLADLKDYTKDIIIKRLNNPINDGRQTPKAGNPIFIAMHATACCCRKCLFNWHRIPKFRELEEEEISYITDLIYRWIKKELYH